MTSPSPQPKTWDIRISLSLDTVPPPKRSWSSHGVLQSSGDDPEAALSNLRATAFARAEELAPLGLNSEHNRAVIKNHRSHHGLHWTAEFGLYSVHLATGPLGIHGSLGWVAYGSLLHLEGPSFQCPGCSGVYP